MTDKNGHHMVMMIGVDAVGFKIYKKDFPVAPEFYDLLATHGDRLRALLDKPVILTVHWDDGDEEAVVTVIDPSPGGNELFQKVRLPFPQGHAMGEQP
jgi:hypothetical protein